MTSAPRKRRPGGGRKPTVKAIATFSTRISAETRGLLEAEAKNSGVNISRLAEILLSEGLRARRYRDIDDPVRALAFIVQAIAHQSRSNTEDGRVCEWHNDPTIFETFKIAVDKILDRLRPPGEIDTSIEGPLISRTPEQQAEAISRGLWNGLLSATAHSPAEVDALMRERHGRPLPDAAIAAMSLGSYTWANVRKALIKDDGRKS